MPKDISRSLNDSLLCTVGRQRWTGVDRDERNVPINFNALAGNIGASANPGQDIWFVAPGKPIYSLINGPQAPRISWSGHMLFSKNVLRQRIHL